MSGSQNGCSYAETVRTLLHGNREQEHRTDPLTESESCHPFLIRFYGTHLRLQLYSLPLQEVLGSASHDVAYNLETLWESYSGAINMLKLVSLFSSRLYFAQDSVHIMTAYSAAFLIKVRPSSATALDSPFLQSC